MARQATAENVSVLNTFDWPSTMTNWKAFEDAKLVPIGIECNSARFNGTSHIHAVDMSCHTKLRVAPEVIPPHVNPEHGSRGGFIIKVRPSRHNDKQDKLEFWRRLAEMGLELLELRSDQRQVDYDPANVSPKQLEEELRPRPGKTRKPMPGGTWLITLSQGMPAVRSDEDED